MSYVGGRKGYVGDLAAWGVRKSLPEEVRVPLILAGEQ